MNNTNTLEPSKRKHKHTLTAVIYDKRGRVLSIAQNNYLKSHPKQAALSKACGEPHKVYLHAETLAILRCKDLSKAHRIQVTRISRSGELLISKPCKICQSYIDAVGIKVVDFHE